jgi:hypothetical protein
MAPDFSGAYIILGCALEAGAARQQSKTLFKSVAAQSGFLWAAGMALASMS